jgi:hypothetical protein
MITYDIFRALQIVDAPRQPGIPILSNKPSEMLN